MELWPRGYREKCTVLGCRNLARVIIRRVEAGGAPLDQGEFCNKDARVRIAEAAVTDYLTNGGRSEVAQQMAGYSNAKTTGLYDRRNDDISGRGREVRDLER